MTEKLISSVTIPGSLVFSLYTQRVEFITNVPQAWFRDVAHWKENYVFIKEYTIEHDLGFMFNPVTGMVEVLEEQKVAVQAQATMRITEIDRKINTLLAIENDPSVASTGGEASYPDDIPF